MQSKCTNNANKRQPRPSANGTAAPLPDLSESHLADLRASGLSDETIRACGLFSEIDAVKIGETLNWNGPAETLGACLVIPFFDLDGRPNGYMRVKPTCPRKDKDGKPIKYESPRGEVNRAYFPPGVTELMADKDAPLLLTE